MAIWKAWRWSKRHRDVEGKARLSTHLCFGNYKGRSVGPRRYAPMFPAFLEMKVDEIHLEMASREMSELEMLRDIARHRDVAVGIVDVKSYYIETVEDIKERVKRCLDFAPADTLAFAPDCGLSQTARWAAKQKLANMCTGVAAVKKELGLSVPRTKPPQRSRQIESMMLPNPFTPKTTPSSRPFNEPRRFVTVAFVCGGPNKAGLSSSSRTRTFFGSVFVGLVDQEVRSHGQASGA